MGYVKRIALTIILIVLLLISISCSSQQKIMQHGVVDEIRIYEDNQYSVHITDTTWYFDGYCPFHIGKTYNITVICTTGIHDTLKLESWEEIEE
jgi:hypothetical protein